MKRSFIVVSKDDAQVCKKGFSFFSGRKKEDVE